MNVNKERKMKTEPIEAYEAIEYCEANNININAFRAKKLCDMAFYEGQSSPKIKQLEWVEVWDGYEDVRTPFGHYVVRPSIDNKTFLMIDTQKAIQPYLTLNEAKAAAQADFEKRVMECLDL